MNKFERLERWIQEMREDSRVKIVEGKRDKMALESFGITNIKTITKSLQLTAAGVDNPIILTDYDRRGEQIKKRLEELFKDEGKSVDTSYRHQLRLLTGIKYIEEIVPRYNEIKKRYRGEGHGKNLFRHGKVRYSRSNRDGWHS